MNVARHNWKGTYDKMMNGQGYDKWIDDLGKYPCLMQQQGHESTSGRYAAVPTIDVVNHLAKANWFPVKVKEGRTRVESMRGFQKHMVRLRNAELSMLDEEQGLFFEIVLVGAHNGRMAVKMHAGIQRFVCKNTMSVSDGTCQSYVIKHVGDAYEQTMIAADAITRVIPQVSESMKAYDSIELTENDKGAFAMAALKAKYDDAFLKEHTINIDVLLEPRRKADMGNSLWKTFNVVQEKLLNGGVRVVRNQGHISKKTGKWVEPRRARSRKVHDVAEDIRLNKALWCLTETMAQLKGGVAA